MTYFREKLAHIVNFINDNSVHKNVLILGGARQTGKTTLIKTALKDKPHLYVDLEESGGFADKIDLCGEFRDFENLLRDEFRFDPAHGILVVDEAQYSRKLGSFVRFMKEKWRGASVILTGSVIHELHRGAETRPPADVRRPVGRETFCDLWPMNFREFLAAGKRDSLVETLDRYRLGDTIGEMEHGRFRENYEAYLRVGGLPAVAGAFFAGRDFRALRADIFKTYEDDFIRYFSLDDVNLFRRSLSAVAQNVGSPSKDSHVVEVDRPGYKKVSGILARLEKWRIVVKIDQLGIEPEQNRFHPKRYLYDIGVLNQLRLRGLSDIRLDDVSHPMLRTPVGGIIENAAALSLVNMFGDDVFGVKLATNAEIDFAVKLRGEIFPVECKMALKFKLNHLGGLPHYLKTACRKNTGILLYGGIPFAKPVRGVWPLPYYLADALKTALAEKI